MTDKKRIRVAAGITALFLASLSVAGIVMQTGSERAAAPSPAPGAVPVVPASGVASPGADEPNGSRDDDEDHDDDHEEHQEHDDD